MLEIAILSILVFGLIGYMMSDIAKKEHRIHELESALVDTTIELELLRLGVGK